MIAARAAGLLLLTGLATGLDGCASVTVADGVRVERLTLPPGLTFVSVRVAEGAPIAVESRGLGLAISPTGARLGALRETVARLPEADACRVVVLEPPRGGVRNPMTDFCANTPGENP